MTFAKNEIQSVRSRYILALTGALALSWSVPACDKDSDPDESMSDDDDEGDDDDEKTDDSESSTGEEENEVPDEFAGKENPFAVDDEDAVADGQAVYEEKCAVCHGDDAKGLKGSGPNLLSSSVQEYADDKWLWIVSDGSKNSLMPGFKDDLSLDERWQSIVYVRSLAE